MSNENQNNDGIGYVQKCGGIPMYPNEFHFNMERPEGISDEEIQNRKKRLNKFLAKYGLHLDLNNY